MKLFGNTKKKKKKEKAEPPKAKRVQEELDDLPESEEEGEERQRTPEELEEIDRQIAKYQRHKLHKRLLILGILVALIVAVVVFYRMTVKPPATVTGGLTTNTPRITGTMPPSVSGALPNQSPQASATTAPADATGRREGVYTFLVVGFDAVSGSSDTMMVGALDTVNHTLNIVNIPRDTLVNVSWWLHKANTLYSFSDLDGLISGIRDITGFTVDSYAIVDLDAFKALVEALGGVYFDVPQDMYYSDPDQNLYINVSAGYQLLGPEDAMGVVRYRAGYAAADIRRIEVQQDFLKAVADQCLQAKNVLIIDDLAKIFKEYVETNLTLGNIAWYMTQMLDLESENINFYTIPANYTDTVNGTSYPTIYLDEWLALDNAVLNPYTAQITENHVNILTRDEYGELYATSGEVRSWYFGDSSDDDDEEETNIDTETTDDPNAGTETTDDPNAGTEPTEDPNAGTEPTDDPNAGMEPTDDPNAGTEPEGGGEEGDSPAVDAPEGGEEQPGTVEGDPGAEVDGFEWSVA